MACFIYNPVFRGEKPPVNFRAGSISILPQALTTDS
jgi:hypothetical protein